MEHPGRMMTSWNILEGMMTSWNILEGMMTSWNILECRMMSWNILDRMMTSWNVPEHSWKVPKAVWEVVAIKGENILKIVMTPDITSPLRLIVLNELLALSPIMQSVQL